MAFGLLKGKKGIIFGALNDMSIAWKVAERVHEEGGSFTLTNTPVALRLGTLGELAERTGSEIISADATSRGDVEKVWRIDPLKKRAKVKVFPGKAKVHKKSKPLAGIIEDWMPDDVKAALSGRHYVAAAERLYDYAVDFSEKGDSESAGDYCMAAAKLLEGQRRFSAGLLLARKAVEYYQRVKKPKSKRVLRDKLTVAERAAWRAPSMRSETSTPLL